MVTGTSNSEFPDTNLLKLFDLLYATRSVTRAADQMGLLQPTASIWLRKLRRQLNDPLFVRTSTGMQPTPAADALIKAAREALKCLHHLSSWESTFDPATETRSFRICMTDASHITLLPQLLAHVRSTAPNVCLAAARIDAQTAHSLESGEADLALGLVPELSAGFYQQSLFDQDWVCLVNAHHPRIGNKLSLTTYRREAHIGIASGTGHRILDAALDEQRIKRRVLLELPGFLGLPAIVSTTDLLVTLPRHIGEMLAKANDLRVFACPFKIASFTVKQHWHARYHRDAGNRWLRGLCAKLFLRKQSGHPLSA
jgi:DNA-binding transcriptional LysR family regulator